MQALRIKNAQRPFKAVRDDYGVPHVEAPDWHGALYALGYLHALDRPTQILFAQVVAAGRSAERIANKPELVETDRFFRRAGLYLHLEREVGLLPEKTQAELHVYCQGVNDGLQQAGRSLPMWATRFSPEPWTPQSVMLIGNLLSFGGLVVSQLQNERLLIELVQAGVDRDKLQELFAPRLDDADFDLLDRIRIANRLSDEALELIADLPRLAGSNAWAVGPWRSATGHALLAADPHLEINRLPAIWYEVALHWPDAYVLGATLPGCPLVAVGRTPQLAWGVTYLKGDTCDYVVEHCRPGPHGWQYRREHDWHDFQVREEVVGRKGATPLSLPVLYNDQGTVETLPQAEGHYLSVRWVGQEPGAGHSLATWLELLHCPSAAAAMDLVRECPTPTLVWVFADAQGHIGRQASGWFPRRGGAHTGLLPLPAFEPHGRWDGLRSTSELPRVYDPPEGFVATANEDLNEAGRPLWVSQPIPDYRKRRIDECLLAWDQATLLQMGTLQYDVISLQARDLLRALLPLMPPGEVRDRLAEWNCSYDPESLEATLFQRFYRNLLIEIFGQEPRGGDVRLRGLGWRRLVYLVTRAGFSMMIVWSIDRLLLRQDSLWWQGRDKAELVRRAVEATSGQPEQAWATMNAFRFTNRFFESQFVGRTLGFHTGDLPMRGCHATPFQGHLLRSAKRETTFSPSYHFLTDLGAQEAWTNLPGGPSESWLSRWYKSDIPLWLEGRYKRLAPQAAPAGNELRCEL